MTARAQDTGRLVCALHGQVHFIRIEVDVEDAVAFTDVGAARRGVRISNSSNVARGTCQVCGPALRERPRNLHTDPRARRRT
jgi:hypothetical protein